MNLEEWKSFMKKIGLKLDLGFEVKYALGGEKLEGVFGDLLEGPTVVSVYMKNNTGSCDKQMISLNGSLAKIRKLGFEVIGLSKDTVGSHVNYAAKHEIDFPIVSDPEYGFAKATDSLVEKKMYGKTFWGPTRSAYVIDARGKLLASIEKVDAANHGEEVVSLLEAL